MPEPMHPSMRELYERLGQCIAEHPAYADEEVLVHVVEDNLPAGVEAIAAIFVSDFEPGSEPLIIAYLDRGPERACPRCGERREDWLPIQDNESVRCGTCGFQYRLPGDEEEPR